MTIDVPFVPSSIKGEGKEVPYPTSVGGVLISLTQAVVPARRWTVRDASTVRRQTYGYTPSVAHVTRVATRLSTPEG